MNIKGILAVFVTASVAALVSEVTTNVVRNLSDKYTRALLKQKLNDFKDKFHRRRESE